MTAAPRAHAPPPSPGTDHLKGGLLPAQVLVLTATVLAFCSPMFFTKGGFISGEPYRVHDWLIAATHDAITRDTLLHHHQLPLRSHLVGGGYPVIAHPSDGSYSPMILTSLLLGEQVGLKANLILALFAGGLGVLLLGRRVLRWRGQAPLFAAMAFVAAGWHPSRILVGYYESTFYLLFPLMLFLILEARGSRRALILAALVTATCLMQVLGGAAAFAIWAMVKVAAGEGEADPSESSTEMPRKAWFTGVMSRRARTAGMLLVVLALAVGLAGVKFLPTADLMSRGTLDRLPGTLLGDLPSSSWERFLFQRTSRYYREYRSPAGEGHQDFFYDSPQSLGRALLSAVPLRNRYRSLPAGNIQALFPEYPFMNVGPLVLGLGVVGLGLAIRSPRLRPGAIALVLFTWVNFGWHAPIDLFRLLALLPLVNEMARPVQYFNFFIYLELVLLAGGAFAWVEDRLRGRGLRLFLLGGGLLALLPTALDNAARYRQAFLLPLPEVSKEKEFYQVKLRNPYLREQAAEGLGNTYLNVKKGIGTILWDSNIKLPEHAVPRYVVDDHGVRVRNETYRGEAWLRGSGGRILAVRLTPNRLEADLDLPEPDLLTLNQNYDPAWTADGADLIHEEGLLRLRCPRGRVRVVLRYCPASFFHGVAVSLASMALLVAIGCRGRRRRSGQGAAVTEPPAGSSARASELPRRLLMVFLLGAATVSAGCGEAERRFRLPEDFSRAFLELLEIKDPGLRNAVAVAMVEAGRGQTLLQPPTSLLLGERVVATGLSVDQWLVGEAPVGLVFQNPGPKAMQPRVELTCPPGDSPAPITVYIEDGDALRGLPCPRDEQHDLALAPVPAGGRRLYIFTTDGTRVPGPDDPRPLGVRIRLDPQRLLRQLEAEGAQPTPGSEAEALLELLTTEPVSERVSLAGRLVVALGLGWQGFSEGADRVGVIVTNRGSAAVQHRLRLVAEARDEDLPVTVTARSGSFSAEARFEAGAGSSREVVLGPVQPGARRLFVLSVDRPWRPRSGEARRLGVRPELPLANLLHAVQQARDPFLRDLTAASLCEATSASPVRRFEGGRLVVAGLDEGGVLGPGRTAALAQENRSHEPLVQTLRYRCQGGVAGRTPTVLLDSEAHKQRLDCSTEARPLRLPQVPAWSRALHLITLLPSTVADAQQPEQGPSLLLDLRSATGATPGVP